MPFDKVCLCTPLGVSDDWIESRRAMDDASNNVVEELVVTPNKVELILSAGGVEKNRQSLAIGTEIDHPGLDGRQAKVSHTAWSLST